MIALTTTRTRRTRYLAAVLLVLQGLAGGAVSLAHASEPVAAPAHIEAQHRAACLALHDELRCALCHYAGAHVVLQHVRAASPAAAFTHYRHAWVVAVRPGESEHLSAPPRAPPLSLFQ